MNTHYGVLVFGGDFDNDHPDEELRGHGPSMTFICAGGQKFCWQQLSAWIKHRPLRRDETAEVLARDPELAKTQHEMAGHYRRSLE